MTSKPATTTKPSETPSTPTEKLGEEAPKSSNLDDNQDGEEIADDLSEISDEADDILGQQEVLAFSSLCLNSDFCAFFHFYSCTYIKFFILWFQRMQRHNSHLKMQLKNP